MTEDGMVGWYHRLNGHDFGQTLGDGRAQGGLVCFATWDYEESDATEKLKNSNAK